MTLHVAAIQCAFTDHLEQNLETIGHWVREAAGTGAQIALPPELFQGLYFCREEDPKWFSQAWPVTEHPAVRAMQELARELGIVIPTSFFEQDGSHYYNSLAMVDADGTLLGVYRKSHIPDGPGYEEKYYFRPGNTGFRIWDTRYGRLGVGICWDQWFPECARAMTLMGAECLFYPTAIGSEPAEPDLDTADMWQRAMQGHSVSNVIPVVAANRIGTEGDQTFYGRSFITDQFGSIQTQLSRSESGIIHREIDPRQVAQDRASMGFFRDRRPELYQSLTQSR